MDADKEVGFVAIGNVGTFVQLDEYVGLACVDHFNIFTILFHELAESESNCQIYILFLCAISHCSWVFPTMTGINNKRVRHSHKAGQEEQERGKKSSYHTNKYTIPRAKVQKSEHNTK